MCFKYFHWKLETDKVAFERRFYDKKYIFGFWIFFVARTKYLKILHLNFYEILITRRHLNRAQKKIFEKWPKTTPEDTFEFPHSLYIHIGSENKLENMYMSKSPVPPPAATSLQTDRSVAHTNIDEMSSTRWICIFHKKNSDRKNKVPPMFLGNNDIHLATFI